MQNTEITKQQFVTQIVVITFSRLMLNTARRFVYTYVSALSRGLGVPITSITSLIAINQGTSVLGIVFGPLGDRFGYKLMMLIGLICLASGMMAAGLIPLYFVLMIAMLLAGLGKSILDPAIQAYVGKRVAYEKRGLIIGLLETAWAGSTLVGVPLMGVIIEKAGWQASFLTIGILALLSLIVVWLIFPNDYISSKNTQTDQYDIFGHLKSVLTQRVPASALLFSFLISIANDNIFVVYGVWLESSFDLSIIALGLGTTVIGISELIGEGMTATIADRLGLKNSIKIGLIVSALSFGLLPFANYSLPFALSALFVVFLSFEFTVVTSMSLATELSPASRASMMSAFFATAGIGRVIGAMLGGYIWKYSGLIGISIVSATLTLLALIVLSWGLKGWNR